MLVFPKGITTIEKIRISVKALILNEGKLLIIKEKIQTPFGEEIIHDFPGGGVDHGETLEEALIREVFEEVSLKIKVNKTLGAWDFIVHNTDEPQLGVQIICIGFLCHVNGKNQIDTAKNPALYENIFDHYWITPQEIVENSHSIFFHHGMKEAVERIISE